MTEGRNPEGALEGQAIDARVRRLAREADVSEWEAEQTLYAHKGDYDAAYSHLEEEAKHGQEGGGCYGQPFPCEECHQVDLDIREEHERQHEEAREEYERDRELEEEEAREDEDLVRGEDMRLWRGLD